MELYNEKKHGNISPELFEPSQQATDLHDKKLNTKPRGYFADAFIRFKKNKSSVVAACIIGLLILYAIIVPVLSPYTIDDKDNIYNNFPPFVEGSKLLNGKRAFNSQSEQQLGTLRAIAIETGKDPVLAITGTHEVTDIERGKEVTKTYYSVDVNRYYAKGVVFINVSYEEFERIQAWQNENDIQVLYPAVNPDDIKGIKDNPGIWYKVKSSKGEPAFDKDGNFVPVYCTKASLQGGDAEHPVSYNSKRIAGDDGSYIYSLGKSGSLLCRVEYYNYYHYLNGKAPMFIFGTNEMGQDLFTALAIGARFSLIFAIVVSAINLTIGAFYGAVQGYYGGLIDLIMDRISDILSEVPFVVVATLFQLHLAQKVGVVISFLFAFVLTGWIGMAALTRKQFYRFKSQEFVYAAKTLGASDRRLMFKHIFPNSLGTIITSCALIIPGVINSETNLTYLGIVNLSEFAGTTVGVLMEQGQKVMMTSPHAMFFPAIFLSLLLISFNLFGNGLRDAFNPSMRGVED